MKNICKNCRHFIYVGDKNGRCYPCGRANLIKSELSTCTKFVKHK